ncbi:MAG: hypothetical protein R6V03_02235, partial [Kiritimatiellia bacterium]
MPFGKPPPPKPDPRPQPTRRPEHSFVEQLRMCAITQDARGTRVGFEKKGKGGKAYFLYVGQSKDGYEVLEADFALAHSSGYRCMMSHRSGET